MIQKESAVSVDSSFNIISHSYAGRAERMINFNKNLDLNACQSIPQKESEGH